MRKRLAIFLASVLLAFLAMNFFGINEVFSVILHSNYSLLFLAILCQTVIMLLYALRFKIIASKYKHLGVKDSIYIATIGSFINTLTPIAKIGGQPFMIYMTKKSIGNEKATAVVFMDTVVDILSSVLIVIAVILVFNSVIPVGMMASFIFFVVITFILLFGFIRLFLSKNLFSRICRWVLCRISKEKKLESFFEVQSFEKYFKMVLGDKKLMTLGMFVSFIIKVLEIVRIWIVFAAIGISLSISSLWIIWALMLVILMIPWLPGHLGLYEFGVSSGFIILGLTSTQAAAGVLLDRFVSFWFVMAFALVVILLSRQELGEVFRIAEKKSK